MIYRELLNRLTEMSNDELEKEVIVFDEVTTDFLAVTVTDIAIDDSVTGNDIKVEAGQVILVVK